MAVSSGKIKAGTPVLCSLCGKSCVTPFEINKEQLPFFAKCPSCSGVFTLTTVLQPKIEPKTLMDAVPFSYAGPDPVEKIGTYGGPITEAEPEKPLFYETCEEVGGLVNKTMDRLTALRDEVQYFRDKIASFFVDQWKYFERFKNNWNPKGMQEWMDFPFICWPIVSEDQLCAAYGRYVLSPKFFNPMFGFNVPHASGGMRLELINQFTRMNFPLDTFMCERFKLPKNLDLKVAGNKIIGGSLALCYKDIPGIAPDNDNTENFVSVYISDNFKARQWLANHGVMPWNKKPVTMQDMNYQEPQLAIRESTLYRDAWNAFAETGRLGIFWQDAMVSRRFATLVGLLLRGVTAVFVSGHKEKMAWSSTYTLINCTRSLGSELAFLENGEHVMWDAVMRSNSVIVDLHGSLDSEILTKLYNYKGRLLVISPDPVMDFHSINLLASRVHGLCGFEIFEPAEMENEGHERVFHAQTLIEMEKSLKKPRNGWSSFRPRD